MPKKTIDEKIDELTQSVRAGFQEMEKNNDKKIDDLALATQKGFEGIEKRLEAVEKKVNTLPDKSYLDEKMADLKGDLIVKLRREDAKMNFLIELLQERAVLKKSDVERIKREFEIFPSMA